MGYYYDYEIRIIGKFPNDELIELVNKNFWDNDPPGFSRAKDRITYYLRTKWYCNDGELEKLSKQVPGYGVILIASGETPEVSWISAAYNGKIIGDWQFNLEGEVKKLIMKIDQAKKENAT